MLQRNNQSGRTMMEMIAVLAVIGVLTVAAIAGLAQTMEKYRISKTHDDILSISQSVVDLYAWARRYPDMSNSTQIANKRAEMCKNDVFPDGCVSGSVAKNVYGGNYEVTTNATASTITIKATGLSTKACQELASDSTDWGPYLVESGTNPSCSGTTFTVVFY